jgi:DNA mismatch repair ATPase MutS
MQDAENASKVLGITLTKSSKSKGPDGKPLTMAGFPYHALDQYLPKLIRGGFRVAICDQLEPPQRQEQTVEHESPQQEENHSRRMRR